jgi:hypothetical protein
MEKKIVKLPEEWRDDKLVGFFLRHVVPIYIMLVKDGVRCPLVFTAFVFSVYDRWLLMTAGHCITDIRRYREELGYRLDESTLLDSLNSDAKFKEPVPFNYDDATPTMLGLHHTWDYGVLYVNPLLRANLEANGVKAFTEESWDSKIEGIGRYKLLGLPDELTDHFNVNHVQVTPIFPTVERVETRPEGFEETTAEMFYGRLPTKPIKSLKGMSGGPVLAFAHVDGRLRYWLKAMQVSSVNEYISAMMMQPLGKYLQEIIEGKHDEPAPGQPLL